MLIKRNLEQQGYIVTFERVETAEGLNSALDRAQWDVVLTDYSMPHFSGLSALALIRKRDIDIPVIVISGVVGEDTAVNMMRAGANDYIIKNNLIRLAPAIERELAEARIHLQKHRADTTIVQQRDLLFTVIDSLDYPFYVIDANDYTVELANKAVKGLNTWENGITCYSLTHNHQSPCDCRQYPCPLKEVVSTGKSVTVEHSHYDKDGKKRNVEVHAHPIFDSEGDVVRIIEYCLDITERKQAEEEILEKQKQLRVLATQLSLSEERERRRIAEGLHDDIIQPLIFLDVKLKTFLDSGANSELTDSYQRMRTIIEKLINDTRNFTFDLSYPVLHALGFEKAVKQWLISEIKGKHGLQIVFKNDRKSKPLDDDIRTFLFKAVKELLVNVVKHAEATEVKVSLAKDQDNMVICVRDDGVGFSVKNASKKRTSFGLFNIRDRIDYLGGSFEIKSEHGSGTQAVITMPLK